MIGFDQNELSNPKDELDSIECLVDSSDESYRMLLSALDLGWRVEEPVYFRPRWYAGDEWVFHFILKRHSMNSTRLITARRNPTLEQLVSEEGWRVDRYPI